MKKSSLGSLIEFFAICGAVAFFCGLADPWMYLGTMVFGCAAAVTKLFYNVAEE